MGNWRDRFEKSINQKTERKLSMYFELYEGAWIPADSPGIWRVDRGEINIICFFQNQAVGAKWIYPQNPGITKSNRDFIVRCRHEQSICRCSGRVSERRTAGSYIFTWEDGRKYNIDRILKIERCASRKAGGVGMMYTCMIQGQESHLFYEVDKWFMERKTA